MNKVVIYNADSTEKQKFIEVTHFHIASTSWNERQIQITCQEADEVVVYTGILKKDEFIGVW